jgi:hypothetical protein
MLTRSLAVATTQPAVGGWCKRWPDHPQVVVFDAADVESSFWVRLLRRTCC